MNTIELLNLIKKKLKEKKAEIAFDMVEGRMTDFNQYHKNVGMSEGLEVSSEIIDETIKQIDKEM